jgi:tRNA(Arg) A34 adenosine deaminase TadA
MEDTLTTIRESVRKGAAKTIHVGDGMHDLVIIKFGDVVSDGRRHGIEMAIMLNHAEVRLLRRRLKAALGGNPRPDEIM